MWMLHLLFNFNAFLFKNMYVIASVSSVSFTQILSARWESLIIIIFISSSNCCSINTHKKIAQ